MSVVFGHDDLPVRTMRMVCGAGAETEPKGPSPRAAVGTTSSRLSCQHSCCDGIPAANLCLSRTSQVEETASAHCPVCSAEWKIAAFDTICGKSDANLEVLTVSRP